MHIKSLPLDTLITGIGRLFKYENKPWFINLWGESEETKKGYYTSVNGILKLTPFTLQMAK